MEGGIKDTFNKYEKKLDDASRSGSGSKNIKEYHLYQQLQFLKKKLQNETTTSINETENEPDNQEGLSKIRYQKQSPKRKKGNNSFEDDIVNILKETENSHYYSNSNYQGGYQTQHFVTSQQTPLIRPQPSARYIPDQIDSPGNDFSTSSTLSTLSTEED